MKIMKNHVSVRTFTGRMEVNDRKWYHVKRLENLVLLGKKLYYIVDGYLYCTCVVSL